MAVTIFLRARTTIQTGVTITVIVTMDLIILPIAVVPSIIGYKIMAAIARILVIHLFLVQAASNHGARDTEPTDMEHNQTVSLITKNVSTRGVQAIQMAAGLVIHRLITPG